jgi:hypothetical protein
MSKDNRRFIVPLLFSILGIVGAFMLSEGLTRIVRTNLPAFDFVAEIPGAIESDVNFLLLILIPVLLVEFLIFTIPIAFFMFLGAKVFRLATYDIDVMSIGEGFDWIRIIKRSVVPALFALSLGELVFSLLQGFIFLRPEGPAGDTTQVVQNLHPLVTFLGGLVALVASVAIFAPSWLLNDSGIVAHVKQSHLQLRRCPDTVGIGRWYSNLVGGFGILAFPITMFYRYFFLKFQYVLFSLQEVFISLLWIVGLPIMVMAFIIPMIILNELTIEWTSGVMRRIARQFGANEVQLEQVIDVQEAVAPEPADHQDSTDSKELTDTQ